MCGSMPVDHCAADPAWLAAAGSRRGLGAAERAHAATSATPLSRSCQRWLLAIEEDRRWSLVLFDYRT